MPKTSDADCIRLWRELETIVQTHLSYLRRSPDGMDVQVVRVESDPAGKPFIMVGGRRQVWGYHNGEGTTLVKAMNDVIASDKSNK
jgi:hypothetical protein